MILEKFHRIYGLLGNPYGLGKTKNGIDSFASGLKKSGERTDIQADIGII